MYDWLPFQALPPYLGGKRRLAQLVLALLASVLPPDRWGTSTFVDAFLGGGSVSLLAKGRGFRVICNDLALRATAIGHGLIANNSTKLRIADVAMLLQEPSAPYQTLAADCYSPSVLPLAHARVVDRALANLAALPEPVRSLAIVLLVKWLLRIQPMSLIRGTDAKAAHEGDFDQVSPRRLGHYMKADKLLAVDAWLGLAEDVNLGIFPGQGRAYQLDVFEFLAQIEGDVVYLDPPYPGTTSYEREYAVLDDLLEGEKRPTSGFSRSADLLTDLFRACEHIPIWLISLNNAVLDQAELEELVHRHRKNVTCLAIPYRHLTSIASEKKNEENREYIVLATN